MNPEADLSVPGLARIINEFMAELELEKVTLVGSGSGGTLASITAARHPKRVARLLLNTGDALENLPAPNLQPTANIVKRRALIGLFSHLRRLGPVRSWYYQRMAKHGIPDHITKSLFQPAGGRCRSPMPLEAPVTSARFA